MRAAEVRAANERAEMMDDIATWSVGVILVATVLAILALLSIAILN
jgi:hypothetical protein